MSEWQKKSCRCSKWRIIFLINCLDLSITKNPVFLFWIRFNAISRADLNKDSQLSLQEVARFVNNRIRQHIEMSIKTNPRSFAEIDISPRDGLISWDEYHAHFLRSKGHDENYIKQHNEKNHVELDRKAKGTDFHLLLFNSIKIKLIACFVEN